MKATRKLIPALALLLISAVLLSTATYAWFTTNSRVTATMNVKVQAPLNLEIAPSNAAGNAAGTWQIGSLDLTDAEVSSLIPVSSNDGITFAKCITNTQTTISAFTPSGANAIPTNGSVAFDAPGTDDVYKVTKDLWLRSFAHDATVTLNFTVGEEAETKSNMEASVRIAVYKDSVADGNLIKVLYPKIKDVGTTVNSDTANYIKPNSDSTGYECVATTNMANECTFDLTAGETGTHYIFVLWIEGNDANTVHINWVDTPYNITLNFSAQEKVTTPTEP